MKAPRPCPLTEGNGGVGRRADIEDGFDRLESSERYSTAQVTFPGAPDPALVVLPQCRPVLAHTAQCGACSCQSRHRILIMNSSTVEMSIARRVGPGSARHASHRQSEKSLKADIGGACLARMQRISSQFAE